MKFEPIHPRFGAEVHGFDILSGDAVADIARIREALNGHQLLLFRSAEPIEPDRQIEIAGWFGRPADNGSGLCTMLHSDSAPGSIRLPFHSDFSFTEAPIDVITLHARAVPDGGTNTTFASGAAAWRACVENQKDRYRDLVLRHRHQSTHTADWPEFVADHPLCLKHPRTHETVLYATEHHAAFVHGLSDGQSRELIAEVLAHIYAPENVYLHAWRPNDLVIWDNIALQHARPEEVDTAKGIRAMQRVTVNRIPFEELIERARQQAA
jgi:taurine dioxygenase